MDQNTNVGINGLNGARDDDDPTAHSRVYMEQFVMRNGQARYAIKRLRSDLSDEEKMKGTLDLALEAEFLSVIDHPNIIKMRAMGDGEHISANEQGFFLVLDRLYEILDDRIDSWQAAWKRSAGCLCFGGDKEEINILWMERIVVAYDLASALRWLHSNKLIYRDIKPDNIGFDVRGNVKIFDFGLCKEIKAKGDPETDLYKLTGITGSRRYMAPEVALCKPYNLRADSYSFGLLLYEIFSFNIPFEHFTARDSLDKVAKGGYRPTIPSGWPAMLQKMVKNCWSEKIATRPTFTTIAPLLRDEMVKRGEAFGGDGKGFVNRSMHMMDLSTRSAHNKRRS